MRVAGSWNARADAQEWLDDERVLLAPETMR
jgi:hypothetical protein